MQALRGRRRKSFVQRNVLALGIAFVGPMISSDVVLMRASYFSQQDRDAKQLQHKRSIRRPDLDKAVATNISILPPLNDTTSGTST